MNNENEVEIRIRNTSYWIWGIKKEGNIWDTYLVNPLTSYKEILRENVTTRSFAMFSNVILKTPFPYSGPICESPMSTVPKIEQEKNKDLESLVERQRQELDEFKKIFSNIAPLLVKLDKNPEIKDAIINGSITVEMAKASMEGKVAIIKEEITNEEMDDSTDYISPNDIPF